MGPVLVDLPGAELTAEAYDILQHPNAGGIVLFSKNYASKAQLSELISKARDIAGRDLLFAVDHEGGRVWRFREEFTHIPGAAHFGEMFVRDPDIALQKIKESAQIIATELLSCGVDLTFAPVLDLDKGVSAVIGDRSYARDPKVVIDCARAFIKGLNSKGMASVGKHFPGHGGCSMDSHFMSAVDDRSYEEIVADDMSPFVALHPVLSGIMPAHVLYPSVDNSLPCFSKFWLQDVLRHQIGFTGTIISDCLSMAGAVQEVDTAQMANAINNALKAGCDMVIMTQATREYTKRSLIDIISVLDKLTWQMQPDQCMRIQRLAANVSVTHAQ